MKNELALILDFGSQYTQLIAKQIRKLNVYCEIHPCTLSLNEIKQKNPKAIILSGSPFSITNPDAPKIDPSIFDGTLPVLGICYGMQLMVALCGGEIEPFDKKEYGYAELNISLSSGGSPSGVASLFSSLSPKEIVWMSHGDAVRTLPNGFRCIATTENSPYAAIAHYTKPLYALQFHPEVAHTFNGAKILDNFLTKIAGFSKDWTPTSFIEFAIADIREKVGDDKVILGLSGGVDSSVTAALLYKAIGDQLIPIFVDTGLMRKNERDEVKDFFENEFGMTLHTVDAQETFLSHLAGITDPEQKRKIIGKTFIEVFEQEARTKAIDCGQWKTGNINDCQNCIHNDSSENANNTTLPDNVVNCSKLSAKFLAQGTLYPDVIESVSFKGPSATIKSHHNVGGLPERMNLTLIEPMRELFKDEVRAIGKQLGVSDKLVNRHPFPGPGLAIRIIGDVTPEKVALLQDIDAIFIDELHKNNLYDRVWQAFAVLIPVYSVGVMGDERTYEQMCGLRAVTSTDGMTADWAELPYDFLKRVSNRIINEVRGVNKVVYDISSKPPSTIEWE